MEPWQEPSGCCEQTGDEEFLEAELTHWAVQEEPVSPEGKALHCGKGAAGEAHSGVGWGSRLGQCFPFSDPHSWESGAFPILIHHFHPEHVPPWDTER